MSEKRLWREGLEELFAHAKELEDKGLSKQEIKAKFMELELAEFERATKFMLDGGLSKPDVKNFWRAMASVKTGCVDDHYDVGDTR